MARAIDTIRIRAAENGATVSCEYKSEKKQNRNAPSMYEPAKEFVFSSVNEAKKYVNSLVDKLFDESMTDRAWKAAKSKWDKEEEEKDEKE